MADIRNVFERNIDFVKKFIITIEELLSQEFEVEAKNAEDAMNAAEEKYRTGEFVLELGEVSFRQMAITEPDGEVTEWVEF